MTRYSLKYCKCCVIGMGRKVTTLFVCLFAVISLFKPHKTENIRYNCSVTLFGKALRQMNYI
jgi:hypothetical protein